MTVLDLYDLSREIIMKEGGGGKIMLAVSDVLFHLLASELNVGAIKYHNDGYSNIYFEVNIESLRTMLEKAEERLSNEKA